MAVPRFEVPAGAIDGVNTLFTVSTAYQASSTAVYINGQLKDKDNDDGWIETSPLTGLVTLKEAPLTGDTVHIFFIDETTLAPGTSPVIIDRLVGVIRETEAIRGVLDEGVDVLRGQLVEVSPIVGRLIQLEGA